MLESGGNVSSKETITDIIKIKSQCKMQEGEVETFCNWCPISGCLPCHGLCNFCIEMDTRFISIRYLSDIDRIGLRIQDKKSKISIMQKSRYMRDHELCIVYNWQLYRLFPDSL